MKQLVTIKKKTIVGNLVMSSCNYLRSYIIIGIKKKHHKQNIGVKMKMPLSYLKVVCYNKN